MLVDVITAINVREKNGHPTKTVHLTERMVYVVDSVTMQCMEETLRHRIF